MTALATTDFELVFEAHSFSLSAIFKCINTLQYSGLENSMGCTVHGVAKSQTRLSNFHFTSLDQEGKAFMSGVSAPIKELSRELLTLLPCEDTVRRWLSLAQEEVFTQHQSSRSLILDLRTARNKFLLFISLVCIISVLTASAN